MHFILSPRTLNATGSLWWQTGQQWGKAEAAEAAEACLAAGLQLARRMDGELIGPNLPAANRERNAQLLFDLLAERAMIAWTLQQKVHPLPTFYILSAFEGNKGISGVI